MILTALLLIAFLVISGTALEAQPTSMPPITLPSHYPRRPTKYSEAPFYDVFTKISSGIRTRTTYTTRPTRPTRTTRTTNTHRPTKTPPVVRYKADEDAEQIVVCGTSVDNYHLILSPVGVLPGVADLVCRQFGWQYAIPPEGDWQKVHWLLANCTGDSSGLFAYDGFYTSGCQFAQQGGAYLMKLETLECIAAGSFPIICMDTPVSTTTTTTSIPFTTTTTVTAAKRAARPSPAPINKAAVVAKRTQQLGVIINGYDVCTSDVNGYHMVYDIFTNDNAAQVCSDLGWYLADVSYSDTGNILSLYDACLPYDIMFNINSYDGLAGGVCNFAYIVPWPSVWMILSDNPLQCTWFELPVICQEDPTSVTIESGTYALSTTTTTTLRTVSYATSTTTTTVAGP